MNSNLAGAQRRHSTYHPVNRDHKCVTLDLSHYKSRICLGIFTNLLSSLKIVHRARVIDPVRAPRFLNFLIKRSSRQNITFEQEPLNRKDLNGYLFMPSMVNSSAPPIADSRSNCSVANRY